MAEKYLVSARNQFAFYKGIGDKTLSQLSDEQLFWKPNEQSNSIAIIIQHLSGNMLSRWTDFLNSDGEKDWRDRDAEFIEDSLKTRVELENEWERGWRVLYSAIDNLSDDDLEKTVFIRHEPQLVVQAINRQLAHYPYHIGQMAFIGKMLLAENWENLSIPPGHSKEYNRLKGM